MIALASTLSLLRRVPPLVWAGLCAVLVIFFAWRWHSAKVEHAFVEGGAEQARMDELRFREAAMAAQTAQRALKAALAARQAEVSKGTDNALLAKTSDLSRRHDDLRLRWAAYRADQGGTGGGGATGVSGPAAGIDDAACAAGGWVSFDTAAAAALAADTAIARDDAWRDWVKAQAAAWPE
jgi:hypothetical protein